MFVKIFTNQDIWGCGEGVDAIPGTYYLVKNFENRLKNQNPLNVHRLFENIRRSGFFQGAQSGMYVAVLSAIETALWDIAGKALNLPVYQLLGGKFRDKIRVYCDTALYQRNLPQPKDFVEAATKAKTMGFNAMKFDLDQANDPNKYDFYNWTASPGELQRMYDQIAAAREAVGPKIDILVDMHGRYDAVTAQAISKRLEPLNLLWLEEPIPAENVEAYKLITESTSTPIAAGENHYLAYGFRRMLEIGAVDIVMPDLQKTGGLGEGQRIANLANLYYTPFAPHMVASFLGCMASCHVCASVPNFLILEWQSYFHTDPMFKEIVKYDGEWVKDSFITLSEKPGIGVEINEEGMKKYATPGVPFFE
jgi:galactonate dehydratase